MKLVASAKYARSIRTLQQARPYREGIANLAIRLLEAGEQREALLSPREEKKSLVIVIATDRGLCGGLNTNLFKATTLFLKKAQGSKIACSLGLWGRKALAFGGKMGLAQWRTVDKRLSPQPFSQAQELAESLIEGFLAGSFDKVYIAYSHFENAISQKATVKQVLPLTADFLRSSVGEKKGDGTSAQKQSASVVLEPERELLLPHLLRSFLAAEIFYYFLASIASENAARMTAMDNATNNADEVISKLTLQYNQARQAAITKELIEITSGAEAL
jgi:F-type H+-transporting ATPase subunit gamma